MDHNEPEDFHPPRMRVMDDYTGKLFLIAFLLVNAIVWVVIYNFLRGRLG